jgi:ATP-dependent Lon protease
VEWAERADNVDTGNGKEWNGVVGESELEKILGVARWDGEEREREERRGVTFGLVVSGVGEGGILPVETMIVPGSGRLKLTGSLGEVCGLLLTSSSSVVVTNLGFIGHQRKR